MSKKPTIALAIGDPEGVGPEICLKAARDPAVRATCNTILVCDWLVMENHIKACGVKADLRFVLNVSDAKWSDSQIHAFACRDGHYPFYCPFGKTRAEAGQASIAYCRTAIHLALAGKVDAVVAAPQSETSIAMAGIKFDGHPSFVARETGTNEAGVYMMLCFGDTKIAHVTLHRSVHDALTEVTRENVARAIRATDAALKRLGVAAPRIAVSGVNPHAGEGGLFGREEIEIIRPAMEDAAREGMTVEGPFGADTMFHMPGYDAFVVMLHDQGHIAAKLLARNAAAALTIGVPILFSSVAHGTGHDIAGKGVADPSAMIEAVLHLSKAGRRTAA